MNRINRVYLIRHGQINGYEDYPVYGHTDVDLTEIGILQMQQMSERLRLAGLEAIYSSDLKRSTAGARIIARYHDVPVHFLPELREMHFGDWEGMTLSDIQDHFPEELEKRKADLVKNTISASYNERGSQGLAKTLIAVQEQRVQTLVISEGYGAPGSVCTHCGSFTLRETETCPVCGGEARIVPDIVEHLVRRAIGMDIEVVFVESEDLDQAGSIGSVWRF